jgi:signal transduction protein with GAF and PtsI domain
MQSFLGVPILVRGEAWGNLYLTDKQGSDFDEADEEAAVILAGWAAIAIENARLYQRSERRRAEHEKALRGLQATQDITVAIGEAARLERVLELIVKRGRALVDARSIVILLRDGDELEVAAHAGYAADVDGVRVPLEESTAGEVMRRRRPERIADVANRMRIATSSSASQTPARPCSCRSSSATAPSASSPPSIAARPGKRSPSTTSRCYARSPPAPRRPWR